VREGQGRTYCLKLWSVAPGSTDGWQGLNIMDRYLTERWDLKQKGGDDVRGGVVCLSLGNATVTDTASAATSAITL